MENNLKSNLLKVAKEGSKEEALIIEIEIEVIEIEATGVEIVIDLIEEAQEEIIITLEDAIIVEKMVTLLDNVLNVFYLSSCSILPRRQRTSMTWSVANCRQHQRLC